MNFNFRMPFAALTGAVWACGSGAATIEVADSYAIDSAEKIAAVRASDGIDIAEGASVTYSDADHELFLNVPVTGKGTFIATAGKKLVLEADSRNFEGEWDIADTFTAVSNRYGLGSASTKQAKFTRSDNSAYLFMLWFGGNGLTNDVPLRLNSSGAWPLKENVAELRDQTKVAVFNGKITHGVALSLACYPAIYNGGTGTAGGSLSIAPINSTTDNYATGMNGAWARFPGAIKDGAGNVGLGGGNYAVVDYYLDVAGTQFDDQLSITRARVICGAKNAIKSANYSGTNPTKYRIHMGGKYTGSIWRTAVLDLNGYDQTCSLLRCAWDVLEEDGETYLTQVTNRGAKATLTMTYDGSRTTATRFEGPTSLDWRGTGSYRLAQHVSTSTGELLVHSGSVELMWNAGWLGDAVVTNADARLIVSSARGFLGHKSTVTVDNGGRFEVAAGGKAELAELVIGADGVIDVSSDVTVSVKTLTVNGRRIPSGVYSRAGFVAEGLGAYVTGEGLVSVLGDGAAAVRGSNPFDRMLFEMKLPATTAQATVADIQDSVTHSAATPMRPTSIVTYDPSKDAEGYAAFGTPNPLSIAYRDNIPNYYYYHQNVTNAGNVLVFPKNVGTDANSVTAAFSTPVLWQHLPKFSGSNVSVRIRFKWAGNYVQGDNWAYDQYLFHLVDFNGNTTICSATVEAIPPTADQSGATVRGSPNGADITTGYNVYVHSLGCNKDVWYDYVWVFEQTAENTTVIRTYFPTSGTGIQSTSYTRDGFKMRLPTNGNGAIVLGGQYGQYHTYGAPGGNTKWCKLVTEKAPFVYSGFTGEIAEFQIFDGALTEAEAQAVLTGYGAGMTMRLGQLNGSADEFAAADEVGAVSSFDAHTTAPEQIRSVLDTEHPAVTITCPFRPEESGVARYLTIGTLREDVMSAPLEVRVNGQLVDTLVFDDETVKTLFVKGRYLTANGDGKVIIELRRPAPVGGRLFIDAVQLSGGWAVGALNGRKDDWCFTSSYDNYAHNGYLTQRHSVIGGYGDIPFVIPQLWGLKNEAPYTTYWYPEFRTSFDLPAAALGETATVTFEFGVKDMNDNAQISFWINGHELTASHVGSGQSHHMEKFSVPLPKEYLRAGINTIRVRNTGDTFGGSQYNTIDLDCMRLTVHEPSTAGMILLVR